MTAHLFAAFQSKARIRARTIAKAGLRFIRSPACLLHPQRDQFSISVTMPEETHAVPSPSAISYHSLLSAARFSPVTT